MLRGDVESDRRDERCRRKNLQGHSIQPLYNPYRMAFHGEGRRKKDFQPLTARVQGSSYPVSHAGLRNTANDHTCIALSPRCPWIACLHLDPENPPASSRTGVCVKNCANSAQIEYHKQRPGRDRMAAQLNHASPSHSPLYGMSEGLPSCVSPPLAIMLFASKEEGKIRRGLSAAPCSEFVCVTRSPASD